MFEITDGAQPIKEGDFLSSAREIEARDLARGLAGALFVSLPLLFTMEMWEIAKLIPDWVLLVFLALSLVLNRLFLSFSGFRKIEWQKYSWWDAIVVLGIGAFASAVTLYVVGIISVDLHFYVIMKTIAMESIATSLGAAVAINQLGGGDGVDTRTNERSLDMKVLLGTLLGAYLFAFNIAPTMETKLIASKQDWNLSLATVFLSLAVSYLTVKMAAFETHDLSDRIIFNSAWLETVVSYLAAFIVSLMLLWMFGYGTPLDPMEVWFPQAIALSYGTSLGGAAGRLVL